MGYSRQYFYKHCKEQDRRQDIERQIKQILDGQRKILPRLGGRKLHHQIKDELEARELKMGRDKLFDVLRKYGMLIVPKRRHVQTTMSRHWLRKYPNMVKGLEINRTDLTKYG